MTHIASGSCRERLAGEGPAEGLGHGLVEVGDKRRDALLQFGGGFETAPAQELAGQDGKPDFDLVEPRSVFAKRDFSGGSRRSGSCSSILKIASGSSRLSLGVCRANLTS